MKHKLLQTWARKSAKLQAAFALLATTATAGADTFVVTTASSSWPNVSSYSSSIDSKVDMGGSKWKAANFNNNNYNGWTDLRCGYNKNATTATISSLSSIAHKVTKVTVNAKTWKLSNKGDLKSVKLYIADNNNFTNSTVVSATIPTSLTNTTDYTWDLTVASPAAGLFYKVEFDCAKAKNNGFLGIESLLFTYEDGQAPSVATPEISCADNKVTITCATDGAAIFYTTDGTTTPTAEATKYNAPFLITANTTIKAVAIKDGESSNVATYNAVYEKIYSGYDEITADDKDAEVKIDGPITVLYQNGRNLYTMDSRNNYMLLFGTAPDNYTNGDKLTFVKGEYTIFNGLPEIQNYTLGEVVTGGATVDPVVKNISEIGEADANAYIKLEGVSISGVADNSKNFTIEKGTDQIAGFNNFSLTLANTAADKKMDIVGVVSLYNKNNEAPTTTVQVAPISVTEAKDTGIAGIEAEKGEAVYFNLQGVRVQNPENGVFIRVQNGKAVKIVK